MSNILADKSPSPSVTDFLLGLIRELEAMHRDGKAHGGVKGDVREWLDNNANFNPEKFLASATCASSDEENIVTDVNDFMACARILVSRSTSLDHATFRAEHYSQENLPKSFLEMIEKRDDENSQSSKMSDFLAAFEEGIPETATPAIDPPEQKEATETRPHLSPAEEAVPISIALPNGTVGKPYEIEPGKIACAIATQRRDDPEHARIVHLQLPDECGLVFDSVTGTISGVPTRSLEEQLQLAYIASSSGPAIICKVALFINPDPASLWKDEPTSPDAPYQKESLDHREYTFGQFRVVAASRRGRSHAIKGDFRDDDFAIGHAESTGWLVVAVADGAGSAKYSRQGSRIAVTAARDRLIAVLSAPEYAEVAPPETTEGNDSEQVPARKLFSELLYESALHAHYKIREEVEQPSQALPEPPGIRNFDTTLILLIMKKVNQGFFAATFSIGDGGAGIVSGQATAEALTHSDGGEHAGQTTFVTIASSLSNDPENIAKRFKMTTVLDFTAALAMSDGITDPKFPSDAAFADPKCWHALWDEIKPVVVDSATLLEWMNFFSPGNHDDRTLVVVMPAKDLETA